jgi:hypothetical protein
MDNEYIGLLHQKKFYMIKYLLLLHHFFLLFLFPIDSARKPVSKVVTSLEICAIVSLTA